MKKDTEFPNHETYPTRAAARPDDFLLESLYSESLRQDRGGVQSRGAGGGIYLEGEPKNRVDVLERHTVYYRVSGLLPAKPL